MRLYTSAILPLCASLVGVFSSVGVYGRIADWRLYMAECYKLAIHAPIREVRRYRHQMPL